MKANFDSSLLETQDIFSNLASFFQASSLEQRARESRFIERSTSKLTGWMFLQLHLLMQGHGKDFSLTDMCQELSDTYGIDLTKQSLDERFNTYAVKFMRQSFAYIFSQTLCFPALPHPLFQRVILTDATSFQLPAHLASFYPGNGGDTGGASIKIQQQYELLTGSILKLALRAGKENDAVFLQEIDYAKVGQELHLMDLGYFKLAHLQALDAGGGFFISRYKTGTNGFIKTEQGFTRLDWPSILAQVEASSTLPEVYIGQGKLKVRLIIEKVPSEVLAKRLVKQKRKQANQSKSGKAIWQTSDLKKQLLGYNLFITNTTPEQLSPQQVHQYYQLRWQIELLFKIWKSIFQIDQVGKMSIFRWECYLYSRLIAILLSSQVQALLMGSLPATNQWEMSEWKVMKYLKKSPLASAGLSQRLPSSQKVV